MSKPDILLLGQITIDDTVPARPGIWHRELGGNAFYSLAGALLWCSPERLGMVARVPEGLPFDVHGILHEAGLPTGGLRPCTTPALTEWILYEADGNRQSMPRNPELRDPAADAQTLHLRYLQHLRAISSSAEDIPSSWLPAEGIHLAPQVVERHFPSCVFLEGKTNFLSIDPSPHYSRGATEVQLRKLLPASTAFLPSQAEVQHRADDDGGWEPLLRSLLDAGFPEVVLKRGSYGCLLAKTAVEEISILPAAQSDPIDLTGAGDAFSGAYMTNRALGHSTTEAARRAVVTAAMVIECSGTLAALRLKPQDALRRLAAYS